MIDTQHYQQGFVNFFFRFCRYLPHVSIILAISTILYLLYVNQFILLVKVSIFLIPLILVSSLLIWKRSLISDLHLINDDVYLSKSLSTSQILKIYGIIFVGALGWIILSQTFDLPFLILIFLMYGLSIFHIYSTKIPRVSFILTELIITSLLFRFGMIFSEAYSFPSIDISPHLDLSTAIMNLGSLLPETIGGAYTSFPLYHVLIAATTLVTGGSSYFSSYLVTIPLLIISLIFVYYVSKSLTHSSKISILAALFYLLVPLVLFNATTIMPMTLATGAYFIILYLLFGNESMNKLQVWILTVVMLSFMLLVHHMTMPLVLALTALLVICYMIFVGKFTDKQIGVLILVYSIPLVYWVFVYLGYLIGTFNGRFFSLFDTGDVTLTVLSTETFESFSSSIILGMLPSVLMIILLYFGYWYFIVQRNTRNPMIFLLPCNLVLLIIFIPNILDFSYLISTMLQVIRFRLLLAPLFAIFMGVGCVVIGGFLYRLTHKRNHVACLVILLCLLCVFVSPVMINSTSNDVFDNTEWESSLYFNDQDYSFMLLIPQIVEPGSNLYTDFRVDYYFSDKESMRFAGISYYPTPFSPYCFLDLFTNEVADSAAYPYILFREKVFEKDHMRIRYAAGDGGKVTLKWSESGLEMFNKNSYTHAAISSNGDSVLYYYSA